MQKKEWGILGGDLLERQLVDESAGGGCPCTLRAGARFSWMNGRQTDRAVKVMECCLLR